MDTITDFLIKHKSDIPVSFHMPGHKGRVELYRKYGFDGFMRMMIGNDITEIPGADVLQQPSGALRQVMINYANQYGALKTELLAGGSTVGIIAAILSQVPRGGTVLMERNSHMSAFNALRLGGIKPVYIEPRFDEVTGMILGANPNDIENKLIENPSVSVVFITSPNYYGRMADIDVIANIAHKHDAMLIVDQAHGAHLKFFDKGGKINHAAENCGADIAVNSVHKTLLSFTGSSILNICSERPDAGAIEEYLRMLQTSSPSYLLLGSLDMSQRIMAMAGDSIIRSWKQDLRWIYDKLAGIELLDIVRGHDLDMSKISISMEKTGVSAERLMKELMRRGIWAEMKFGEYVMLLTGAGNVRSDYEMLYSALREISREYPIGRPTRHSDVRSSGQSGALPDEYKTAELPRLEQTAVPLRSERIPLYQAEGRVLVEMLTPYPPGVPAACPGDIITYELILYLQECINERINVVGVDDEGTVAVGIDSE